MKKFLFLGIFVLGTSFITSSALAQSARENIIKNRVYKISLIFPSSWGKIKQTVRTKLTNRDVDMSAEDKGSCPKENGKLVWKIIVFRSRAITTRFIEIHRVPKKYADCLLVTDGPHSLLKSTKSFDYYWATSYYPLALACDRTPVEKDSKAYCEEMAPFTEDFEAIRNSFKLLEKE